ncbi:hypothetical protein Goari_011407 [Gossypium aridum]|uniref:Lipoxygenase n=1 Tax=Gossypium aridum TaxID=34290 RepID=A0A7J8WXP5_GOSAI|nr:hypothetical protein [Gossypium aridum]
MLKPQVYSLPSLKPSLPLHNPFIHGSGNGSGHPLLPLNSCLPFYNSHKPFRFSSSPTTIKATATATEKSLRVKATVKVKETVGDVLTHIGLNRGLNDIQDLLGKSILLELVSMELDPSTGLEKERVEAFAHRVGHKGEDIEYEAEFQVGREFGEIGAVCVENEHHEEMYVDEILIHGFPKGPVKVKCASWVHSKYEDPHNRVFFTNKTPNGLKKLREKELMYLRGNGTGERKKFERIYDYDVYNDLGDPDHNLKHKRSVLGGKHFPYPRRCRTGRWRCETVDSLFSDGISLPPLKEQGLWNTVLLRLFTAITEGSEDVLRFKAPDTMARDKFFWFRDEEFARQTLVGLNPHSIRLVTEWPLKSKLDPSIYGPAESAITDEMINQEIRGIMTVEQALRQKRLFILDYHDLYLPYVKKVRELNGTTLYGSRTLFFLNSNDTLRPLAIELTRSPMDGKPQWKQVYVPSWGSTACWLWRFAKTHVLAHYAGYHQLVSHWLRTHCVTEPYIIATNRQLSINALARESLINADGIIENSFSPSKYSLELCTVAYDLEWRFDH